ncbi:MAG: 4-keto-6-deoxy-N-Acetyl-D-hexosaminyl-(Lipid carrier) aminotransferase [Candidatus Rifleibacterium amylolyticum]|nr:MAG: 4-keto-6-deoxy-N-Acetyl-D-hexosaminyl-(Lipid carrier) aminotransferase [Candidatus Rifleibacterium amylolyticum]
MTQEFAHWPYFGDDEKLAVGGLLTSGRVNYWTGDEGRAFECEYAGYTGRKFAVAVFNGTVALELALYAYDIGAGDEVIVTSRTFIASASCAVMRGAVPVIADVDADSQNITAATIEKKITRRTRAIICVHLAGWPCDMRPIMDLAARHNLIVIEDCAQAHGARYNGRPVGSIGHIAAFSFCQDKIISTAGEGGMLVTDDEEIFKKCWAYKDHGKSYDAVYHREHAPGFRWLHESFGTNWRMTEIQAAIGRLQLRKLDGWVEKRREHADRLNKAFAGLPALRLTIPPAEIYHSYYKYYMFVRPEMLKSDWSRDRIMAEVSAAGVPCYSGSCSEIYLEKAFEVFRGMDSATSRRMTEGDGFCDFAQNDGSGWLPGPDNRLPVAKELGETSLMLLVHPTLTAQNIEDTISVVKAVVARATR